MIDLSEIREEIATEAQAAAEAAREAKWRAQREAEDARRVANAKSLALKIIPFIKSPHQATINSENGRLSIDGVDVGGRFWLDEEFSGRGWHSRTTGKRRLCVEEDSTRYCRHRGQNVPSVTKRSFPQKKAGGWNYEAVADILVAYAIRRNAEKVAASNKIFNDAWASKLRQELGLEEHYGAMKLRAASVIGPLPYVVDVSFTKTLTEDQVRLLQDALVKCGVLKK